MSVIQTILSTFFGTFRRSAVWFLAGGLIAGSLYSAPPVAAGCCDLGAVVSAVHQARTAIVGSLTFGFNQVTTMIGLQTMDLNKIISLNRRHQEEFDRNLVDADNQADYQQVMKEQAAEAAAGHRPIPGICEAAVASAGAMAADVSAAELGRQMTETWYNWSAGDGNSVTSRDPSLEQKDATELTIDSLFVQYQDMTDDQKRLVQQPWLIVDWKNLSDDEVVALEYMKRILYEPVPNVNAQSTKADVIATLRRSAQSMMMTGAFNDLIADSAALVGNHAGVREALFENTILQGVSVATSNGEKVSWRQMMDDFITSRALSPEWVAAANRLDAPSAVKDTNRQLALTNYLLWELLEHLRVQAVAENLAPVSIVK
jgi:hypothetical protein